MRKVYSSIREATRDIELFIDKSTPAAGLHAIHAMAERVQRVMQVPGKRVTYPIHWDSVRQMMAFFASNGFGEGIPYRRKGRYEQGWQLRRIEHGTELFNRTRGARFIGGLGSGRDISPGKKQSSIHKGRHRLVRPVVDDEIKKFPHDVIERLRIETSK